MEATVSMILKVVVFSVIAIVLYNVLKVFILSKVKVNLPIKIGSTILSVVLLVLSAFLSTRYKEGSWQYYIGTAVVLLSILTTADFWVGDKNKRIKADKKVDESSMKPRPKAKPNRVKNRNK